MKLKMLAASVALLVAASTASAQEVIPIDVALAPSAGNGLVGTFERAATGLFLDTYTFTPSSVAGAVSVTLRPLGGPVNFFVALLNDEGFSYLPESGSPVFSFQTLVSANTPLSLTVFGFAGDPELFAEASGSYGGSVQVQSVAVIPEPETYALLLAGLGVVAAVARRRRDRSAAAR